MTLIRAELLALRTTRAPWVLAAAAVLLTFVLAVTPVFGAGKSGPSIGTAGALLAVLGAAGRGSAIALLIGVLAFSVEFRHETATATFLRTPRRTRVVAAKASAGALVGAGLAVIDLVVALAVGLPTGAVQPSMLNPDILLREAGLLLAYPLYAALGTGLAALLVHQPVAVVLPMAWVLFLEDLLLHLVPKGVASWSLGGVSAALANAGDFPRVLPVPIGGAALLGYALLLLSLGAARLARRDLT